MSNQTRLYLEIDDVLRWLLTGEFVRVVEADDCAFIPDRNSLVCYQCGLYRDKHDRITLRWPSGDRISYSGTDPIWRYFELAKRAQ